MEKFLNKQAATINGTLFEGSTSFHLHFLRGLAALLVLINHYRNFFLTEYNELENPNVFVTLAYSVAGLGHQAVMIFFVLSGFFITKSVLTKVVKNSWSWKDYLISRMTRLYVVLVPVLLIVCVMDLIGSRLFDYSFVVDNMDERLNPIVFLGNLAFLQEILVPRFGTNAPLWSLAYEFWYYMLFPCLVLLFVNSKNRLKSMLYLAISIAIVLLIGKEILLYFIVWSFGALLYILPRIVINNKLIKLLLNGIALFALIASLGLSRLGVIQSQFVGDILVTVAFSMVVYSILYFKIDFNYFPKLKRYYHILSEKLAGFSYTLYLIHYPVLVFVFAYVRSTGGDSVHPTVINVFFSVIACGAITVFAYLLSLVTEAKTDSVRNLVFRLLESKESRIRHYKDAQ